MNHQTRSSLKRAPQEMRMVKRLEAGKIKTLKNQPACCHFGILPKLIDIQSEVAGDVLAQFCFNCFTARYLQREMFEESHNSISFFHFYAYLMSACSGD
jgi:hypothetical protein